MAKNVVRKEWTETLSEEELRSMIPAKAVRRIVTFDSGGKLLEDEIAASLEVKIGVSRQYAYKKRPKSSQAKTAKKKAAKKKTPSVKGLWERFIAEFNLLLCTDDRKYATVREQLAKVNHTPTLVVLIASSIGSCLGVAAGLLTSMAAYALLAIVVMGRNAYCDSVLP